MGFHQLKVQALAEQSPHISPGPQSKAEASSALWISQAGAALLTSITDHRDAVLPIRSF